MGSTITKSIWLKSLLFLFFVVIVQQSIAQTGEVKIAGVVYDEGGVTMPGVTVRLKGSTRGATTDANGRYTFSVPNTTGIIVATYLGYKPLETPMDGKTAMNLTLIAEPKSLNEVVVIGYGTQKREMVTSSIATVKSEDFNKGVISDPLTLITGKVAGLAISRVNGSDPNSSAEFSLRGAVSVEGTSSPLVVIDGVPGGDLRTIAPQDIESYDILRDGSAAAIYGSRATGGVIIITTKKGATGPTRVTYNGYIATETVAKRYDVLTGDQYREFAKQIGFEPNDGGANTDWFKELTRKPVNHGHNLSVNGGTGKTTYNASVNYQGYQGIDLTTSRKFLNASGRLNTKALNDKLDFSVNITNSFDNKRFAEYYGFGQALNINPTYPVRNPDGTFYETPTVGFGSQWNPVANTVYNTNDSKESRFLGNTRLSYAILPSLKADVSYSLLKTSYLTGSYTSRDLLYMQTSGLGGTASRSTAETTNNILEATLNYSKQIKEHNFSVLAGYSYQNEFNEGFNAGNNYFNTDAYLYYNLGAGAALRDFSLNNRGGVFLGSYGTEWTLLSYFGRATYDFKDRYLFSATLRREGASKLGASNKWANFVAVSGGWIISKESFMQDVDFVKNLKIRAGYGVTGNQQGLQPYQSLALYGPYPYGTNSGYMGNGVWVPSAGPTLNSNPNLRWETKKEYNIGLEFTLFKSGWLSGSVDYYTRRINDLIGNYYAQVPSQIYPLIFANAGLMTNKGVELTLNAKAINNANFKWNIGFVGSYNKNKVVSISNDQFQGTAHGITDIGVGNMQRIAPGYPVSVFYGKKFAGFADDGGWLFYNQAGQKVTADNVTDEDNFYLGNSVPQYNLGLTNSFSYKNFDFSVLVRSGLGFKAVNGKRLFHENITQASTVNFFTSVLKDYVNAPPTFSSYYLENGNYLKIDNVTLGYTVPVKKSNYLRSLRFSVAATNLVTITKFSGMDPELGLNPFSSTGVEYNSNYYPRTRSFTFGVTADF
ncbi:SusC/RagA family TonB-linked outer membrane protein [Mucilaginibacter conchicola]|uniref:SusC/RagA family TonB-linked outer membrane protein n=1 Tax=Mucilaginibacter conchicola TaxID=2303333 RepID=A0A372NV23_9SPHI|nr:SusC/RagA family TonB-linked outer membrane protein [Mucilaginibacter conchicola]RFZ93990.1 SusC/RagA family TonB-linked outer membrane protein [Mucilaginibacter conchicola]